MAVVDILKSPVRDTVRLLVGVLLVGLLSGCGVAAQQAKSTTDESGPLVTSPFYQKVGALPVGPSYQVVDSETDEHARVSVVQEYTSAAGVLCRNVQLLKDDGTRDSLTLCRSESGQWFLAPSIQPDTSRAN